MTRLTLWLCALLALLPVHGARAYSLQSGLTTSCHERIMFAAFLTVTADLAPGARVPLPASDTWRKLVRNLVNALPDTVAQKDDPAFQLLLLSILIGIRAPDTEGHSVSNLNSLRRIHADPSDEGQYAHALRGIGDDGPEGDAAAVAGTRAVILDLMAQGREALQHTPEDQIITRRISLDFYGVVDVDVWAPAYYTGRAMHALQDSFSHTLRSPDFTRIISVFNYVEAVAGDLEESRDGLAHSDHMDTCGSATAPLVAQAELASADLLTAAAEAARLDDDAPIVAMLDTWVTYGGGCTISNGYCDSEWLDEARTDATGPYLGPLACGSRPGAPHAPAWVFIVMLVGLGRRRLALLAILGMPGVGQAQVNLQFDTHLSILSDAPGRSILASTYGLGVRGGWRWERWGAFAMLERNFWVASEQTAGIHSGVLNTGVGGEAIFAEGQVRASFAAGVSILREATALHGKGQVGVFSLLRPLGIRWETAPGVFVLLDPVSVAVVSPVVRTPRILMLQYRTHLAVETTF